jgi:phosphoribosylformylglycinamidine synthase
VLEAVRNLACVGAEPRALVNCLNFGNPEHPEVMWQFSEVVDGMSEACRALDLPVVGGNVSFYNESRGTDIDPTPVAGVVGVVPELTSVPPGPALVDGDSIVVLGGTAAELGGSEWATRHGLRDGAPPAADLASAAALHAVVRDLVNRRIVHGVHDCADGGLAVAIAEMAVAGGVGATLTSPAPGLAPALAWFSESASRVVFSVAPDREIGVVAAAINAGVPAVILGRAGGDRIEADGAFSVTVADATAAWRDAIPNILGTLPAPA